MPRRFIHFVTILVVFLSNCNSGQKEQTETISTDDKIASSEKVNPQNHIDEKQNNDRQKKGHTMNRLAFEKSPYLLQHADNPVDWYPWGEEAFAAALKQDKPIFLSIGYSTCHWCHVMEHESFEDEEVAALLNEYFISIKVDREERPDIDNIYMTVCQMMTGSGGWPLTIIMTPDKKPFFSGTYFPKESLPGRNGMLDLIPKIAEAWQTRRQEIVESSEKITGRLQTSFSPRGTEFLGDKTLEKAYSDFLQRFDHNYGGFKGQRKFPTAHNLVFLLRYWKRTGEAQALEIVEKTLQAMRRGGIYDQVGLGFHRYSTDPKWLLPHFEKMLYDQAINAMAYLEAYQATGKEQYAHTAREIFSYVLRDMTSPEGGFYSAEDADSEGEEGKFYLWTIEEVKDILGEEDGTFFAEVFNMREDGNFRDESSGHQINRNIPYLTASTSQLAKRYKLTEEEFLTRIKSLRQKLFVVREKRIHPLKDDKILTDWNGLMIAAFAKGAQVLGDEQYAAAARNAADFVLSTLRQSDGQLLKRYREGVAALPAHLEDYAFTIWGLLELYQTTFELDYLQHAVDLNQTMLDLFWDEKSGGFFFTADDGEELIVRTKEIFDGAIPSGNSVAALDLLLIGRITGNIELEKKAATVGKVFSAQVNRSPMGYTQLLLATEFAMGPAYEIVIVGDPGSADTQDMTELVQRLYVPNRVLLLKSTGEDGEKLSKLAPFTKTQYTIDGKATAFVCQNYACQAPTTDLKAVAKMFK